MNDEVGKILKDVERALLNGGLDLSTCSKRNRIWEKAESVLAYSLNEVRNVIREIDGGKK